MNRLFVYDGTFEGLFSAIAFVLKNRIPSPRFITSGGDAGLFDEQVHHETDPAAAARLYRLAAEKMCGESIRNISHCFLSCSADKEQVIFDYLKAGSDYGVKLDLRLTEYPVDAMLRASARVRLESHRMLGLVRFASVEGDTLYSEIEPDNDILPLISGHFAARMPRERWIIHDKKRGTAAIHEGGRYEIFHIEIGHSPAPDEREQFYRGLWKKFYSGIAIKERTNLRQQKQFMPVRYWKHLAEKN